MSKVEGRGPIDPPPPLCPRVTFFTLCLLGLISQNCNFSILNISNMLEISENIHYVLISAYSIYRALIDSLIVFIGLGNVVIMTLVMEIGVNS